MRYSTGLLFLPAVALALEVTVPSKGDNWTDGQSQTVQFSKVSSDPTSMNVVLINNSVFPNTATTVGSNVDTSSGTFTVPGNDITGTGSGYQINLISTTNGGILAQSPQFNVQANPSGSSSSSSSSMSSSTTSGSSSRTTMASSTTSGSSSSTTSGMSSSTSSASAGASSSASAASSSASSASSSAAAKATNNAAPGLTVEMGGLMGVVFAGLAAVL